MLVDETSFGRFDTAMTFTLRSGTPADAADCGRICYEAFHSISTKHNFPPDLPDVPFTVGFMKWMLALPDVFSVVAEESGRIVGSNFLWEDTEQVAGVGPITVDPTAQNASIGRQMMQRVLDRADDRRFASVRLVQAAYHSRSMSLYAKLGFDVREPLAVMQGSPPTTALSDLPGRMVRSATKGDIAACNSLCHRIHGHDRRGELERAVSDGTANVVEHGRRISGYSSTIGFFGHAVGETTDDIKALIAGTKEIAGPGMLVPTRNAELFRWCLHNGLQIVQPMTLMARGMYAEPQGAFLPSIIY